MMKISSDALKGERGNVLVFVIVVLTVAAVSLPAFLSFSFHALRATEKNQDETQRFYAADVGVEDALFRIGNTTVPVPIAYQMDDVNGYDVSVSIAKDGEGTYRVTSVASKANEPDTTVEATVPVYELTVSSGSGGAVTGPGEGVFAYPADAVVVLQAVANSGYDFVDWSGNVTSIADPAAASTAITMDGDYTIQANFAIPPSGDYWLTTSSTAGGTVTTPGEGSFEYLQDWVVDLLAAEESGFNFSGWTGDTGTMADPGANATTITMSGNYTIVANFVPEFTLTIAAGDGGYVSAPGEGNFPYESGTVVGLTAVPSVGYYFSGWTGDTGTMADSGNASTMITVLGDYSIQANFAAGSPCVSYFEYAIVSLDGIKPLTIENNAVVAGDIYGKAGIYLENGSVITGNAYADGDLTVRNLGMVNGNAHAQGDIVVYNNGKVDGTVYADGDVTVRSNGRIFADAYATGSIVVNNNGVIDGGAHYYGTLTVGNGGSVGGDYPAPPNDFVLPPMPTLNPPTAADIELQRSQYQSEADLGGHYYGDYVVSNGAVVDLGPLHIHGNLIIQNNADVTLLGTVYVDGNISIQNNSTISGNPGALVAEGEIKIWNTRRVDPGVIPVIMSVYGEIELENNSTIDAVLYAPNDEVELENNSSLYGAIVGFKIEADNNVTVTYAPELSGRGNLPQGGCP